jgi:plasmid stabilization system protein ParE
MLKKIQWSPSSEDDFGKILEYLNDTWDKGVVTQFIHITETILKQIVLNPKQFPLINRTKKIRKCVITKHNTLYYRNSKATIDILRIYDSRQNPNNLTFE